jgi:hypothetical protein
MSELQAFFACGTVRTISVTSVDSILQVNENPRDDAFEIVDPIT